MFAYPSLVNRNKFKKADNARIVARARRPFSTSARAYVCPAHRTGRAETLTGIMSPPARGHPQLSSAVSSQDLAPTERRPLKTQSPCILLRRVQREPGWSLCLGVRRNAYTVWCAE